MIISTLLFSCSSDYQDKNIRVVRVGHFPTITHAQAIIGHSTGAFQEILGDDAEIQWKIFSSGTSAVETIFAGELDIAYIGPSPAVNGYIRSNGEALRIVAGSASGGAGLVIREDSGISGIDDFKNKKLAAPSLGNTQYIMLRTWLENYGLRSKERGGNVQVFAVENPDQLTLFIKKEIDGAWTVEPWVTRLIAEGNGRLYLDEKDIWPEGKYTTCNLVVSSRFLNEHPDLVNKFIEKHVEITQWINTHKEESKKILNKEIGRITGHILPERIIEQAYSRIEFTYDPIINSLNKYAEYAYKLGYLDSNPDLKNIYHLDMLIQTISSKNLKPLNIH